MKKGKAVVAKTNAKATPVKRKAPAPPGKYVYGANGIRPKKLMGRYKFS